MSNEPRFRSADHHLIEAVAWRPEQPAERVNDMILMSRGTSNSYLVTTPAGDVVINTGMPFQGARHRERFEQLLGRPLNVKKILLTQSHPDHMGGWSYFAGDGVETIVQRNFPIIQAERTMFPTFFAPRGQRVISGLMPNPEHVRSWRPDANAQQFRAATQYADSHTFELGGVQFELYSTPSGETLDNQIVWLPQTKTVFTGNLTGALWGALPHFYTPRGDRDRSIPQSLRDFDKLLALNAELFISGHDAPIVGAARIRADLTKVQSAVRYLHDETVKGMNAGTDLPTLMRDIQLPADLQTAPGRGPTSWYVRSIWEEYTGWFRQESTTELYGVPQRSVWAEFAELAGGPDVLAQRAAAHIAADRPEQALHFTDIALSVAPTHRAALQASADALVQLINRSEGRPYDELGWLESELARTRAALAG